VARLLAIKGNTVIISFLGSGAEMTQPEKSVVRYALLPGTRVAVEGGTATIGRKQVLRDARTSLLVYTTEGAEGAAEGRLREDAVLKVLAPRDPLDRLETVAFHDLRPGQPEPWGPAAFHARERLLTWRDGAWERTRGVIGLAGARVVPMAHQLITARTCLADRQVRFLLADEVGLGKTIEAGLVIQSLLAVKPDLRVLCIVPGALVSQWFLELYVKFGGRRFLMLDHERLGRHAGNPWKDEALVLASARTVEEMDPKQALRLAQSQWDVLVVDECHRMQPGGVLYKRVAVLSKNTPHVLLLSATPGRSHAAAYLGLLALLEPQVHKLDDLPAFTERLKVHAEVAALLARTTEATSGWAALAKEWKKLLGADATVAKLAAALATGGAEARTALCDHVRAHHRFDHRVVRNRRQVLARLAADSGAPALAMATRVAERLDYKPDAPERAVRKALEAYRAAVLTQHAPTGPIPPRLAHWLLQIELACAAHPAVAERLLAMRAAILADPGEFASYRARAGRDEVLASVLRTDLSENEVSSHIAISAACHVDPATEAAALDALHHAVVAWDKSADRGGTARLAALQERITAFWNENPGEKILVFTAHGLAVIPLHDALAAAFPGVTVETFGAHQDTVAREESVRRFRDDDRCAIMVSDPLGGEGRNFQFVSVIAHHDLPWSVAAVEQRIGRVDRIGRDGEVPSWVFASNDAAAVDAAWAELLDSGAAVFNRPASGLEFVCDAVEGQALEAALRGGAAGLRAVLPELIALISAERTNVDDAEDAAFIADTAAFGEAARDAASVTSAQVPVDALMRWLRTMGGSVKRQEEHPRPWSLRTRWGDQPESGVFDRDTALMHPGQAYFAQGHALIDRLLDDATRADWCTATAWRRKPDEGTPKWEGLRASWTLDPDLGPIIAAGLPLSCLRRLFLIAPPRRMSAWIRIEADHADVELDPVVLALLDPPFDPKNDLALSNGSSRELWTRLALGGKAEQVIGWQDGIRRAGAAAERHAEVLLPGLRDPGLVALQAAFAASTAQADSLATAARDRLGAKASETVRLIAEADLERRQATALEAALAGARLTLSDAAFVYLG